MLVAGRVVGHWLLAASFSWLVAGAGLLILASGF